MLSKIVVVMISLVSVAAFAGASKAGDGGHGVVCSGLPPQMLDIYEATSFYGRPTVWSADESSDHDESFEILQMRERVARTMGAHHPSLVIFDNALSLRSLLQLEDGPLQPTADAGVVPFYESGCQLVQIGIRGTDVMRSRLIVERRFWMTANRLERALFLVHEGGHAWFHSDESQWTVPSALRQFVGLLYDTIEAYGQSDSRIRELLTMRQPLADAKLTSSGLR